MTTAKTSWVYICFSLKHILIAETKSNHFNTFVPNAPFLYHLKTSEKHKVFCCFQGVEKGCIRAKRVNELIELMKDKCPSDH